MNELLFITHTTGLEDTLNSVLAVLKGGCRSIQLRMKESPRDEILKIGSRLKDICDNYEAELYIDDYPDICKELKATGVHLGKKDMSVRDARMLLGNSYIIGGTANTLEDIVQLYEEGVDYIGLGPFRFTATKQNLSPVLGLEGYEKIMNSCKKKEIHVPVLAIGGIISDDIPSLMQTGISGIALSSTLLQTSNPEQKTTHLINLIKQYKI